MCSVEKRVTGCTRVFEVTSKKLMYRRPSNVNPPPQGEKKAPCRYTIKKISALFVESQCYVESIQRVGERDSENRETRERVCLGNVQCLRLSQHARSSARQWRWAREDGLIKDLLYRLNLAHTHIVVFQVFLNCFHRYRRQFVYVAYSLLVTSIPS